MPFRLVDNLAMTMQLRRDVRAEHMNEEFRSQDDLFFDGQHLQFIKKLEGADHLENDLSSCTCAEGFTRVDPALKRTGNIGQVSRRIDNCVERIKSGIHSRSYASNNEGQETTSTQEISDQLVDGNPANS